jgi:5-methyltetrahydropteroyltriglutamate--homocysteine methyltransferase
MASMRHNTDRILVSHAGNLPRPEEMDRLIDSGKAGSPEYLALLPGAVKGVVDRQIELGVDIVNDGEYVKAGSYGGYIRTRLSGFEMLPNQPKRPMKHAGTGGRERYKYPGFYNSGLWYAGSGGPIRPGFMPPGPPTDRTDPKEIRVNTGPVKYTAQAQIKNDVQILKDAIAGKNVDGFVAALGPASITTAYHTDYYKTQDEFLFAAAEAMHEEYKAITDGGLILQIDEPELCTGWSFFPDMDVPTYRKYVEKLIEAINIGIKGLPEDQIRLHTFWGSGHRPHDEDIELRHFADILLKVNAQQLSIEAANVRHQHEWVVWKDIRLPEGRILMPGVISHATDLIEHPDAVAERLINYASVVGRENVQTGTDCGIGSRVGHEEIAWAKLGTMAEGARRASAQLWKK